MLSLRKQPSFFARGPGGVSREGPSCQTPLGPGAKKDGCFRRPRHARWVWSTLIPGLFPAPLISKGKSPGSKVGVRGELSLISARRMQSSQNTHDETNRARYHGKVQNMDPWSMDPLRGPGPWTGSIKIWTGSMDPLFLQVEVAL